jgi:hypothetical protein
VRSGERDADSGTAPVPPKAAPPEQAAAVTPPPARAPAAPTETKRVVEAMAGDDVERALDFSRRNDTALVEGSVARGAPHRYRITGRKGQRVTAELRSSQGARFDLYEPGSSLSTVSGGLIVQGARVAGTAGGTRLDVELPADGTYLLLVRPTQDKALYALEMAVSRGTSSVDGSDEWWRDYSVLIGIALAALAFILILVRFMRRGRRRHLFRAG